MIGKSGDTINPVRHSDCVEVVGELRMSQVWAGSTRRWGGRKSGTALCISADALRMAGRVVIRVAMARWFTIRIVGPADALNASLQQPVHSKNRNR